METLYLLKNVCHDPLALSRFSQFRCYRLGKGKVVPDLNANDEFLVCFVLKGSLCYVLNEKDFSSRMVMENELFFVSPLHHCKVKAMDDVLLAVHACNMVAPYFHRRVIAYLKEISMEEVDPLETLPITPLMRSYLDSLLDYMEHGKVNADLHYAKEYELFSLFRMCYSKQEIASIFRDALSSDLQFFVAVMTHYKTCRTAKELATLCGYSESVFNQLFKKCFAGETPYRWLQMRTSDEIDFMLRNTSVSIKEIMLDYHFKTFSHFTTYCKRNLGATPNEIRQKGAGRTRKGQI